MKEFIIIRKYKPDGTFGKMYYNGTLLCHTIERPTAGAHCAIPEGTYILERYNSPAHGPRTWLFKDVPGRAFIEIHICKRPDGRILEYTVPRFLEGCISVGMEFDIAGPQDEWAVVRTEQAFGAFMSLTDQDENIKVTIRATKPGNYGA